MTTTEFVQTAQPLQGNLLNFALQLTRSRQDAEDLLQETTIKAFCSRNKFLVGTDFRRWIMTIMRNTFINDYRKKKVRRHLNGQLTEVTEATIAAHPVANTAETNLGLADIEAILLDLGDKYSVPFNMYFKGYSYTEIARYLQVPIGTVKSRIFTARVKLRARLNKYESSAIAS